MNKPEGARHASTTAAQMFLNWSFPGISTFSCSMQRPVEARPAALAGRASLHSQCAYQAPSDRDVTPGVRNVVRSEQRVVACNSSCSTSNSIAWRRPSRMSMGQLADCITSAAALGWEQTSRRPSESWVRIYTKHTQHRLHHLGPEQLSSVLRSMVILGYHPVSTRV